nr:myb/SANT-like domain, Harbinger transposase-derived nuclease domain protein [Tanacetum cinerariifolium]
MEGPKKRPLIALLAPMEGPKQRKFWSDEMIKVLLDKCIEEMNSTGRNGTSLHKQPSARLGGDFKQIHKRAASLQSKPLHYSDLCEIVFQSISVNGDGQWTNTQIRASASVSATSASRPSTSRASASGHRHLRHRHLEHRLLGNMLEHSIWTMTLWLSGCSC